MTDGGGAETPSIAALPAVARLGASESARGHDANRHVKLLIQFAVEGALSGAYSQQDLSTRLDWFAVDHFNTGYAHSHVVIRGRDDLAKDLITAQDYITDGMRLRGRCKTMHRLQP